MPCFFAGFSYRRFTGLDEIVLIAVVTLFGHRDNRRINHLPAARNKALGVEMVIELVKQRSLIISALASSSRNSQIVVASGTGASMPRLKNCINESRSRT
ncbi:MAG: hypothetical protein ACI89J_003482 [Hyphomicrobiaceae bacterium]